jgi:hypothetical protein
MLHCEQSGKRQLLKGDMGSSPNSREAFLSVFLDVFFAVLPLPILWFCWSSATLNHSDTFIELPEISATSCVLYGLTLSRYIQSTLDGVERSGPAVASFMIIPLSGVIFSVLLVARIGLGLPSCVIDAGQLLNLAAAIFTMLWLGGIRDSKSNTEEQQ